MIDWKKSYNEAPLNFYLSIISFLLYCVNQRYWKTHTEGSIHYLLQCHFNDFLAGVLLTSYSNFFLTMLGKPIARLHHIMLYCIGVGLFWEYAIPLVKASSVSDPIDILCYVLGGFVYWCLYRLTVRTSAEDELSKLQ